MQSAVYREKGPPSVLRIVERDLPEPGPGEVRVRLAVSGVNPTDTKARSGQVGGPTMPFEEMVPDQDGAGVIDKAGPGIDATVGQRVWVWEAAWQRADGTAQEFVVLPAAQAVDLPTDVSFDVGASAGIPALTAHRCLTAGVGQPDVLGAGALAGQTVLVAGGAGAVGHATIELAKWSGAQVITTVRSSEKADLASAAGADVVIDSTEEDVVGVVHQTCPDGVDLVVEVDVAANIETDLSIVAHGGSISAYADSGRALTMPVRLAMTPNVAIQFIFIYNVPAAAKAQAIADVTQAMAVGALTVGAASGLPITRFPLREAAAAHAAVEAGAIGKVLIDIDDHPQEGT